MKLLTLIKNNYLPIYVISLPDQLKRRDSIKNLFKKLNLKFEFIDAVKGAELNAGVFYQKNLNSYRRPLSPGEMGCSISHQIAYEKLVNSIHKYAIILEDDVILKNMSLLELEINLNDIDDRLIILGGQEGLRRGKLLSCVRKSKVKFYNSIKYAWFFQRTCAYIIAKNHAASVINLWKEKTFLADEWYFILSNSNIKGLGYIPIFAHPIDLNDSLIERERESISN